MRQWEIWTYDFPEEGAHPVVLISNNDRIASPTLARVNVLFCMTLRSASRAASLKKNEVVLNSADGLEWETLVKCDAMHFVKKAALRQLRGGVSQHRRVAISRKVAESFQLVLG